MRLLYEDRLQRSKHDLLDSSHNNKYTHSANHVQVKEIRTRNDKLLQHLGYNANEITKTNHCLIS